MIVYETTLHLRDIMKIYVICLLSNTLFLIFFFRTQSYKTYVQFFCNFTKISLNTHISNFIISFCKLVEKGDNAYYFD